jgi:hypothetical protein
LIQVLTAYGSSADRYSRFIGGTCISTPLPVAHLDDLLQGKLWVAQDSTRRGSKRQKDLADIARLIEAYPQLRSRVPADILSRLI